MRLKSLQVPDEIKNKSFWKLALVFYFIYSYTGMLLGGGAILLGFILSINGIFEKTEELKIKLPGFESQIKSFPVGLGFLLGGIIIFFITRYNLKRGK
jgi:hypothetical protein